MTTAGHGDGVARRRRDPWRTTFFVLVCVAVVASLCWLLLRSKVLVVRHVEVRGAPQVSDTRVRSAAAIPAGASLPGLDVAAARTRVAAIPQVRAVRIERRWPDTVRITVRRRVPAVAVERGHRYLLVDAAGVTVATRAHRPRRLPRLWVWADPKGDPAVRAAVHVLQALPKPLRARLRGLSATDASHVRLHVTRAGFAYAHGRARLVTVLWGGARLSAEKARVTLALLHHPARHYDVSSPAVATTGD